MTSLPLGWEERILLVFGSTLTPGQRIVLLVLNRYCDGNGEHCFPSLKTIAAMSGMTERGVHKVLDQLIDRSILEKNHRYRDDGKGFSSNLYKVHFRNIPQRGTELSSGGVLNSVQGGTELSSEYQYQLTNQLDQSQFKAAACSSKNDFSEPSASGEQSAMKDLGQLLTPYEKAMQEDLVARERSSQNDQEGVSNEQKVSNHVQPQDILSVASAAVGKRLTPEIKELLKNSPDEVARWAIEEVLAKRRNGDCKSPIGLLKYLLTQPMAS